MMMIGMSSTLLADPAPRTRPEGIRILAVICFLLAAYLLISAVLVLAGTLALASGRYLLGDFVTMGPLIYFAAGAVLALLGFGLLRGWRITRRLAIVVAALLMATSLLPVSAAVSYFQIVPLVVHGVKIVLTIMAIRYLLQPEVVEFFSAKGAR